MTKDTSDEVELLPCPFCGGEADMSEWQNPNYPAWEACVECGDCHSQSGTGRAGNKLGCRDAENGLHTQRAATLWNTRAERKEI